MSLTGTLLSIISTTADACLLLYFLYNEEQNLKKSVHLIIGICTFFSIGLMETVFAFSSYPLAITFILMSVVVSIFIYKRGIVGLVVYSVIYMLVYRVIQEISDGIRVMMNPDSADIFEFSDYYRYAIIFATTAVNLLVIVLIKKLLIKNKEKQSIKEITPILWLGLPFVFIQAFLSMTPQYMREQGSHIWFVLCNGAIFLAFVYTMIFINRHLDLQKKARAEEAAAYELRLRHDYYVKRKAEEDKVKEIYHDMKNHLLLLNNDALISEISEKITGFESYIETGNEFLDIIIAEKYRLAQQMNIRLDCDADFRAGEFLEPLDISTIFGNLLDNAIEASEKVDYSERYIYIRVCRKMQLLSIVIKNSLIGKYDPDSLKTNRSFHGYGLTNVKRALEKYGGEMSIETNDNEFAISAVIPIPIKQSERLIKHPL